MGIAMGELWQHVEGAIAQISRTNALYPLLVALVVTAFFGGAVIAFVSSATAQILVICLFGLVLVTLIGAFLFFMFTSPHMLRSEKHVIQQQVLTLLGDQAHGFRASPRDLVSVLNPDNPIQEQDRVDPPPIPEADTALGQIEDHG